MDKHKRKPTYTSLAAQLKNHRAHQRKKPGKPIHKLVEVQHTEKCFEEINAEKRNRDNMEVPPKSSIPRL